MYLSWNFLKNAIQMDGITPAEFAEKFTISKIEVESFAPLAQGNHLVIGFVKSCIDHPESDHLHVCEVDIGSEVRTIVCGASNVAAGQKVIVALPGAVLPAKGVTIQHSTIRGIPSEGMICSLQELGLPEKFLLGDGNDGIEVLPEDAPIGHLNPLEYLGYDDVLFELKPTPDRGDALSLQSLVYEAAAVVNRPIIHPLSIPMIQTDIPSSFQCFTETEACSYFSIQAVSNIAIKPSPRWLQTFLMAHGIRSINNVVDIGNYVMLLTGQPLHMYDADKLPSKTFVIRQNQTGMFHALDDKKYPLSEKDVVVTCGGKAVSLAGVMGSLSTLIDANTTNLAIEAAHFDGPSIRATSQRLQLISDSSIRFSRGIDPTRSVDALSLAISMLKQYANAQEVEEVSQSSIPTPSKASSIMLSLQNINRLLGTNLSSEQVEDALRRLQFSINLVADKLWEVTPPSYRLDVKIEADVIEEIIRLVGFEKLPLTLPILTTIGELSDTQKKRIFIRNHLLEIGLHEAMSYTLESADKVGDFCVLSKQKISSNNALALSLPMTSDRTHLRRSIIPSLLEAMRFNQARGYQDINFYEISNLYHTYQDASEHLGIVLSGELSRTMWRSPKILDFYTIKGLIESILQLLGIETSRFGWQRVESDNQYYHPGRSAYLTIGKQKVGVIGQIHPQMSKKYEIKDAYIAELDLEELFALKTSRTKFSSPNPYPSIRRDIAVIISEHTPVELLLKTIKKVGRSWVVDAQVFDIYRGAPLEEGMRSVAIMVRYQDSKRTLRDQEVNELHEKVITALANEHQAVLRT